MALSLSTRRSTAFGTKIRHVCPINTLSRLRIRKHVLRPPMAGQQDPSLTAAGDGSQNTDPASAEALKAAKERKNQRLLIQTIVGYHIATFGYFYVAYGGYAIPGEAYVEFAKHVLRSAAKRLGLPV